MPVLRLELENFKSYGGHHVIPFGDSKLTCIVGPNGSGKSNVMDALSFVLGVSSQQLRSSQLVDLIWRRPDNIGGGGGNGKRAAAAASARNEEDDDREEEEEDSEDNSDDNDDDNSDDNDASASAAASTKKRKKPAKGSSSKSNSKKKQKGRTSSTSSPSKRGQQQLLRASASLVFLHEDDDDDESGEDKSEGEDDDDDNESGKKPPAKNSNNNKKTKRSSRTIAESSSSSGDENDENDKSNRSDRRITTFTRNISPRGACEYKINHHTVSWDSYQHELAAIGVLVKVRNCLVFQGDVEALARKKPSELVRLVEEVSGSFQFADEYDACWQAKTKAEQVQVDMYKNQKSIKMQRRALKSLREESERYEHLLTTKSTLQSEWYGWMLYQMDQKRIECNEERTQWKSDLDRTQHDLDQAHDQLADAKKSVHASRRISAQAAKKKVTWQSQHDGHEAALATLQQEWDDTTNKLKADDKQLAKAVATSQQRDETLQHLTTELEAAQQTLQQLTDEYEAAKAQQLPNDAALLTRDQEVEYEQLRQRAQAETADRRRELAKSTRKLEASRADAATLAHKVHEGKQVLEDAAADVQRIADRIDKLSQVRAFIICLRGRGAA
jgi:chromosome segregation ATPase